MVYRETGVADGSFLPFDVSWDSRYEAVETINYMKELEEELASMPDYRKLENKHHKIPEFHLSETKSSEKCISKRYSLVENLIFGDL